MPWLIQFNKTEIEAGVSLDKSGPCGKTYSNPNLNCAVSQTACSSRHTTGGFAVSMAGELLPPLLLYDSSANNSSNFGTKEKWVNNMGWTMGKYGLHDFIKQLPYIAVRSSGNTNCDLFMQMIEEFTYDLIPEKTISKDVVFDFFGRLEKGLVMWTVDFGPGCMTTVDESNDQKYNAWTLQLWDKGVYVNGLCPNTTSVSAIMDELFCAFKIDTCCETKKLFVCKIYAQAKAVKERRKEDRVNCIPSHGF